MNLDKILFFFFYFTFIHSASLSRSKASKLNSALNAWKKQISSSPVNIRLLDKSVTTVASMIKTISDTSEVINEIYFLSSETLSKSNEIYSNLDKEPLHRIFSDIYSFSSVFPLHMTKDELVRFFYSSMECVIKHGTDWSFSHLLIEPTNNEHLLEILEFIGKYFKNGDSLKGKDALWSFYIYHADLAKKQGLIEKFVNSDHVLDSLLFIHKTSNFYEPDFHQWVRIYFPYIHKVFNGHLNEPSKVKVLLDLSKRFTEESDVDWAVLIFSANNIADLIYSNPLLLAKALDILSALMEKYTKRFTDCIEVLGVRRAEKLVDELEKRSKLQLHFQSRNFFPV